MRHRYRLTRAASAAAVAALVVPAWRAAADVFTNVPEAAGYNLVYTLNVPTTGGLNAAGVTYAANNAASIARGSFDRIAYYVELNTGSGPQWVYASMNAFTDDARRIGVPNQSGGFFQRPVTNVNVDSNVGAIVKGTGLNGFNLEFWRTNYGSPNSAAVPNASGAAGNRNFDWGDQATAGGYGSMQLHNNGSSQPLFAFNRWGASQGNVDLGIGVNPTTSNGIDWTFQQNGATYTAKSIQVLVRPSPTTTLAHKLQIMPLGDSITEGAGGTGGSYRTRLADRLDAAGIDFEFVGSQVVVPSTTLSATGRVTHEGHSGYRIDQLQDNMLGVASTGGSNNDGKWLNPTIQPDVVLVHIGTNDFGQNFNTSTAIDRFETLLRTLTTERPSATVIVTNLMDRSGSADTAINAQFNPFVPGLVSELAGEGRKVYFLDMNAAVPLSDMPDGLHPNQTGYTKMGDAWFGAIMATIPEPTGLSLAAVAGAACLARRRRTAR